MAGAEPGSAARVLAAPGQSGRLDPLAPFAAGGAAAPAVIARDVRYRYRDRRALDGVSFEVAPGELFAFLGPNGSGKSTLFRLLATLVPLQEGEVQILGSSLRRPAALRRQLGVVFQSPSLDLQLTVQETLRLQALLHALPRAAAAARREELLARFGLAARRRERVGTLSGGLRRRLELARALLASPRLLLLDEPSTGLDPGARRQLWDELAALRRQEGLTVLLTTHFMEEADRCDRLALLHQGRIVATGTPRALKSEIGGDTATLTSPDPDALAEELRPLLGGGVELLVRGSTVRFVAPRAAELAPRLLAELPGRVTAVTVAHPTLEDVFLRHAGEGLG